jgi:hypothetical protein
MDENAPLRLAAFEISFKPAIKPSERILPIPVMLKSYSGAS